MFNGIRSKLLNWALKQYIPTLKSLNDLDESKAFVDDFSFLQSPEVLTWVGVCCDVIARTVRKQKWQIYNLKDNSPVESGSDYTKLISLLNNPSPAIEQRGFKNFVELWVWRLLLTGKQPILKSQYDQRTFKPYGLILLRPDLTDPIIGSSEGDYGRLNGWNYQVDSKSITYKTEEIILSVLPHPYKRFDGLGMIERNKMMYNTEELSQRFNYMFFKNNAIQDTGIMVPENLTIENEKRLRANLESMKGVNNQHKFHILMGGMDIKSIGVKHSDMQFQDLRKMNRGEILAIFNMPPAIVGIFDESKSMASVAEQRNFFLENAVQPMLDRIADTISREIVQLYNPAWYFEFDAVDTRDQRMWSELAVSLVNAGIISPNEAREGYIGYDESENPAMDLFYKPLNMYPVGEEIPETEVPIKVTEKIEVKKVSLQLKQAILKIATLTKNRIGKKTKDDMKDFFKGQEQRVLANVEKSFPSMTKGMKDVKAIFNADKEDVALKAALRRSHVAITAKAIEELNDIFDANVESDPDAIAKRVAKLGNLSTIINDTTMDKIHKTLIEGIEAGETMAELKARVAEVYTQASSYRAEMIAKTEGFRAWDQGTLEQYQGMNVKMVDVIGCEDDSIMEGQTYGCNSTDIPIDEAEDIDFHPNHTGCFVPQI